MIVSKKKNLRVTTSTHVKCRNIKATSRVTTLIPLGFHFAKVNHKPYETKVKLMTLNKALLWEATYKHYLLKLFSSVSFEVFMKVTTKRSKEIKRKLVKTSNKPSINHHILKYIVN